MEKRALGKGLQALLPDKSLSQSTAQAIQQIPLDQILPNRNQPRKFFSEDQLAEMAASIKQHGVLQPIVIRRTGDGAYELIAGERRVRAARLAGLTSIPALVRPSNDETSLALAIIENIQRSDLNPIEEAKAYAKLINEFGLTQDQVAKRVGKERSSIANILRLASLPQDIQTMLETGALSLGHAKVLCGLKDPQAQRHFARRIVDERLSVRQTERAIEKFVNKRAGSGRIASRAFSAQEEQLRKRLGTKTTIEWGTKGGKIVIHFFSEQELERILELITGET
ncbi:MAG: ParB/RepB/Spo0J family partition protein [Nitrospirae bacterium]|nr:MAG: ParB/RepB/Spo0J family partition protein [Nitrospirota bacterium]